MIAARLLPLCIVLASALACAGAKNPTTDEGPAGDSSKGDDGVGAGEGGEPAGEGGEPAGEGGEGGGPACTSDADCVPAECCHPSTCTVASAAPSCGDVMCTLECRPGTLDCGQGECLCQNGSCVAVIGESL